MIQIWVVEDNEADVGLLREELISKLYGTRCT